MHWIEWKRNYETVLIMIVAIVTQIEFASRYGTPNMMETTCRENKSAEQGNNQGSRREQSDTTITNGHCFIWLRWSLRVEAVKNNYGIQIIWSKVRARTFVGIKTKNLSRFPLLYSTAKSFAKMKHGATVCVLARVYVRSYGGAMTTYGKTTRKTK